LWFNCGSIPVLLIRSGKWKNSTTGVASDFGNLPTTHVEKKTKKAELLVIFLKKILLNFSRI